MPLANADLHGGAVETELSEKFGKAVPMRQAEPMLGERPADVGVDVHPTGSVRSKPRELAVEEHRLAGLGPRVRVGLGLLMQVASSGSTVRNEHAHKRCPFAATPTPNLHLCCVLLRQYKTFQAGTVGYKLRLYRDQRSSSSYRYLVILLRY